MSNSSGHLCFVVPFISKQLAKDWHFQNRLLRRTLESIVRQDCGAFTVLVVGHDRPTHWVDDDRVDWLQVDFPLSISERDARETENEELEVKWTDRGRKLYLGTAEAAVRGATHILPVDSDDLVSRRLAGVVARAPASSGWAIWSGYRYYEGEPWVQLKPHRFLEECGTGTILKISDIPVPSKPEYDRGYAYYKFLLNHAFIERKMALAGRPLQRLPSPSAVYVIHGCNFYARVRNGGVVSRLKDLAMRRSLNDRMEYEFGRFDLS